MASITTKKRIKDGKKEYKGRWAVTSPVDKERHYGWGSKWFKNKEDALADARSKMEAFLAGYSSVDQQFQNFNQSLMDALSKNIYNETTLKSKIKKANSLYNNYFPKKIRDKSIHDFEPIDYQTWLNAILMYPYDTEKYGLEIKYKNPLNNDTIGDFRSVLKDFNKYLSDERIYADQNFYINSLNIIEKTKITGRISTQIKKEDVSIDSFTKITNHYRKLGLHHFINMYWYTFFYVLFFTGLRPGEIVGLRWKDYKRIENGDLIFEVRQSISDLQDETAVYKRLKDDRISLKTKNSNRYVPLITIVSGLVYDYYWDSKRKFDLNDDEIQECFIFGRTNMNSETVDPHRYNSEKNTLRRLQRVCKEEGIPKTSILMFRHAFSALMTKPIETGGLGLKAEEIKDFIGHVDEEMIKYRYAKPTIEDNYYVLRNAIKSFMPEVNETQLNNNTALELLNRLAGEANKEYQDKARKTKLKHQIESAIKNHKETFRLRNIEMVLMYDIISDHIKENNGDDYCDHISFKFESANPKYYKGSANLTEEQIRKATRLMGYVKKKEQEKGKPFIVNKYE